MIHILLALAALVSEPCTTKTLADFPPLVPASEACVLAYQTEMLELEELRCAATRTLKQRLSVEVQSICYPGYQQCVNCGVGDVRPCDYDLAACKRALSIPYQKRLRRLDAIINEARAQTVAMLAVCQ